MDKKRFPCSSDGGRSASWDVRRHTTAVSTPCNLNKGQHTRRLRSYMAGGTTTDRSFTLDSTSLAMERESTMVRQSSCIHRNVHWPSSFILDVTYVCQHGVQNE